MKILVTPTSFKADNRSPAMEQLRSFTTDLVFNLQSKPLTEDEVIPLIKDCEGYIAGLDSVSRKVIENAPKLKVISRYGVGVDKVDLIAAKEKGITVTNTPAANSNAVADLTFGLLLSIARKIPLLDRKVREGEWPRSNGFELYGKTFGIIGLGSIGKLAAKRAAGFSMRVLACDPVLNRNIMDTSGVIETPFERLIAESDFISLHCPLMNETRNIINEAVMKSMKKGAVIINTARGGLLDESAAYELLKSGHLGGLGMDSYETEPPGASPLFTLDNVVLTPHTGAHTAEATAAMANMSVRNLIDVLSGNSCQYIVNK